MTKNTKIIIGVVSGLVLMGGFVVVVAAAIGISYLASQKDTAKITNSKNVEKPTVKTENKLYKQSDADALVKFHEWASETKFSDARRKKFEAFLDRDFRRDAAKARKDTDDTIEAHKKIRAEKDSVQEFTRAILAAAYIEDFRKKRGDAYAQFMLAVYEKREDDSPDVSDDESVDGGDVSVENAVYSKGSMARELVGKWQRSEGSGSIDYTGKTQYKSGTYFNYEFSPDGTVVYSSESDVLSILQCEIAETKRATGTATVSGDTLTINFGKMAHTYSDSCKSSDDVDETLPAETVSLNWRLKTEYETTQLCIDEKDGEKCYDRKD